MDYLCDFGTHPNLISCSLIVDGAASVNYSLKTFTRSELIILGVIYERKSFAVRPQVDSRNLEPSERSLRYSDRAGTVASGGPFSTEPGPVPTAT